jgi:hypothetical protein
MEQINYTFSGQPQVQFQSVGGDLRLSGTTGDTVEIQAAHPGGISAERSGDRLVVSCRSGCLAFLPANSRVRVDRIGGDMRMRNLSVAPSLGSIGGDLSLRQLEGAHVEWIGGDLDLRRVRGAVSIQTCGGDARITDVTGDLTIRQLGGDLVLREVSGDIDIRQGGSAKLSLTGGTGKQVRVEAGGDVACTLPVDADVQLDVYSGGDLKVFGPGLPAASEGRLTASLGGGTGSIKLQVGGDLWLEVLEDEQRARADLGEMIAARVEAQMVGLEAKIQAASGQVHAFDAERIEERVRRAVSRSLQRASQAAELKKNLRREANAPSSQRAGEGEDKTQERLRILRMLQGKKISVDEAQKLMDALEGDD